MPSVALLPHPPAHRPKGHLVRARTQAPAPETAPTTGRARLSEARQVQLVYVRRRLVAGWATLNPSVARALRWRRIRADWTTQLVRRLRLPLAFAGGPVPQPFARATR